MGARIGTGNMGNTAGWLLRVCAALSQLINAAVLGGNPDDSVSARCERQGVVNGHCG